MIMRLRTVISFVVMTGISLLVYHFLPNRKLPFRDLILGSIFCSLGWLVISFVFSMYLTIFKGFSGLYGSMTAIILVMLWLYFCMYVMLLYLGRCKAGYPGKGLVLQKAASRFRNMILRR